MCHVGRIRTQDHSVYAPSQWQTTIQCNVVSHWLGAYTNWSLYTHYIPLNMCVDLLWFGILWPYKTIARVHKKRVQVLLWWPRLQKNSNASFPGQSPESEGRFSQQCVGMYRVLCVDSLINAYTFFIVSTTIMYQAFTETLTMPPGYIYIYIIFAATFVGVFFNTQAC